jgi:mannosyltransferase OCH1-like enzyme
MHIPKIIHQIWFQGEENIPEHMKEYHKTWIYNNPNFEIKVWDEKSIQEVLIKFNDKETTDMYNNYIYMIQKIDLAKYIILYIYGGIYIDMDVKSLQPITDDFLGDNDVILSKLMNNFLFPIMPNIINNGIIMNVPRHPILLYTIEEAKKNKDSFSYYISKTIYIFSSTGPICLTVATNKFKSENDSSKIKIVDGTYFEACDVIEIQSKECKSPPDHAIGLHMYESSWIDSFDFDNIILNIVVFIVKYKYLFLFVVVLIFFLYYLKFMKYFKKMKLFKLFKM